MTKNKGTISQAIMVKLVFAVAQHQIYCTSRDPIKLLSSFGLPKGSHTRCWQTQRARIVLNDQLVALLGRS